SQHGFGIPVTF
nr:immunoglobulin light chain junction region [Macaca mulatta]